MQLDFYIIKSFKINGDIIEWKFNSVDIEIKIKDLKNQFKSIYSKNNFYVNSRRLFILFISLIIIMILMYIIIKQVTRRTVNRLLMNISLENNNDINFGMNNEQVVNNLENVNQNNNNLRNNENIPSIQIPRDDVHSISNEGSPNQLNT